ncbi:MAG: hypothetical protein KDA78_05510 [Planctomycetaceae bacterium]|nr:hypothetical protein [Planctomycetaceae bacterium]
MNYLKTLLACGLLSMLCTASFGEEISDYWKFILKRPAKGWQQEQFDDSRWREGYGGFGTRGTPGARVGTKWETDDIWMRKAFELETVPAKPALLVHHDEDAEIFINGKPVANLKGYTTEFVVVPIAEEDRSALKTGKNILAVHCHQTGGGQFIDVHVVDSEHIPALPPAHRSTKPYVSELITHWGAEVTPENAWTEYPRPQLRRKDWTNLNGHWDYAVTSITEHVKPAHWEGQILVPYCLESKLGGVQRLLDESEALWYHRSFQASKSPEKRLLLNFEAVDYRCEVFVNGQSVGKHTGGNIPFFFDISHAIVDGENELLVRVEDATEQFQLRGKQVLDAHGIWYTQVSGIWQTVWLEEVPALFAEKIKIETITNGEVTIHLTANGRISGQLDVIATVRLNGKEITHKKGSGNQLTLNIPNPQLWTPDTPTLYDLELHLNGDVVHSYFGIREVGKTKDAAGHWRFTLNGQPIFHWGPLDQGWWPDGLLTPPSDEGMLFDIEWLKSAGFNMIRKHIKVEPRRYYYHCDRVGMMVWQDQVSGGTGKFWPRWTRLDPNPTDAEWPEEQHEQFMRELDWMITSLESHPSIVTWVPFNEAWGQHKTIEVGRWTSERDPSRLVNIASG